MTAPVSIRESAPAKINLGLRVVGCRPDGYHELDSLFVPIDIADEVEIRIRTADRLEVTIEVDGRSAGVPADASNLAARAAHEFAVAARLQARIEVRVIKRIPTGAGLGGGSSDAGAVLRALRDHRPGAVDPEPLARIALALGADVPFFLDPQPMHVTGIGEHLEPARGVPALPILLVNPGQALDTARVYRAFDALNPALTREGRDRTLPALRDAEHPDWGALAPEALRNDLEPAAVRLCPPVARLRERIRKEGAHAVGMSGSGATVFGLFESEAAATGALERIGFEAPVWARVATTIESR